MTSSTAAELKDPSADACSATAQRYPETPKVAAETARPSFTRRWTLRLLGLCLVATCLIVFHQPILRATACFFVVDEAAQPSACVFIFDDSPNIYEQAAQLYRSGRAPGVLIFKMPATRTVRLDVVPSAETLARRELSRRGVPADAIRTVPCDGMSDWDQGGAVTSWMTEHPETPITVLCDRLGSRRVRFILDSLSTEAAQSRVRVRAIPDPCYDEANWWKRKEGVMEVFRCTLLLGYDWLNGGPGHKSSDWDADAYERALAAGQ